MLGQGFFQELDPRNLETQWNHQADLHQLLERFGELGYLPGL